MLHWKTNVSIRSMCLWIVHMQFEFACQSLSSFAGSLRSFIERRKIYRIYSLDWRAGACRVVKNQNVLELALEIFIPSSIAVSDQLLKIRWFQWHLIWSRLPETGLMQRGILCFQDVFDDIPFWRACDTFHDSCEGLEWGKEIDAGCTCTKLYLSQKVSVPNLTPEVMWVTRMR